MASYLILYFIFIFLLVLFIKYLEVKNEPFLQTVPRLTSLYPIEKVMSLH